MRGTVAKRLRKIVYGDVFSHRFRIHTWSGVKIVADPKRVVYKEMKKAYVREGGR